MSHDLKSLRGSAAIAGVAVGLRHPSLHPQADRDRSWRQALDPAHQPHALVKVNQADAVVAAGIGLAPDRADGRHRAATGRRHKGGAQRAAVRAQLARKVDVAGASAAVLDQEAALVKRLLMLGLDAEGGQGHGGVGFAVSLRFGLKFGESSGGYQTPSVCPMPTRSAIRVCQRPTRPACTPGRAIPGELFDGSACVGPSKPLNGEQPAAQAAKDRALRAKVTKGIKIE